MWKLHNLGAYWFGGSASAWVLASPAQNLVPPRDLAYKAVLFFDTEFHRVHRAHRVLGLGISVCFVVLSRQASGYFELGWRGRKRIEVARVVARCTRNRFADGSGNLEMVGHLTDKNNVGTCVARTLRLGCDAADANQNHMTLID
jgi:hypothetical protein